MASSSAKSTSAEEEALMLQSLASYLLRQAVRHAAQKNTNSTNFYFDVAIVVLEHITQTLDQDVTEDLIQRRRLAFVAQAVLDPTLPGGDSFEMSQFPLRQAYNYFEAAREYFPDSDAEVVDDLSRRLRIQIALILWKNQYDASIAQDMFDEDDEDWAILARLTSKPKGVRRSKEANQFLGVNKFKEFQQDMIAFLKGQDDQFPPSALEKLLPSLAKQQEQFDEEDMDEASAVVSQADIRSKLAEFGVDVSRQPQTSTPVRDRVVIRKRAPAKRKSQGTGAAEAPSASPKRQKKQAAVAAAAAAADEDDLDDLLMQAASQKAARHTSDSEEDEDAPNTSAVARTLKVRSKQLKGLGSDPIDKYREKPSPARPKLNTPSRAVGAVSWSGSEAEDVPEKPARKPAAASSVTGTPRSTGSYGGRSGREVVRQGKVRARRRWTEEEVENLKMGVEQFGPGNWAIILDNYDFDDRTSVDLKDKWRNMVRSGQVSQP